jgi:hypothetical protein
MVLIERTYAEFEVGLGAIIILVLLVLSQL